MHEHAAAGHRRNDCIRPPVRDFHDDHAARRQDGCRALRERAVERQSVPAVGQRDVRLEVAHGGVESAHLLSRNVRRIAHQHVESALRHDLAGQRQPIGLHERHPIEHAVSLRVAPRDLQSRRR